MQFVILHETQSTVLPISTPVNLREDPKAYIGVLSHPLPGGRWAQLILFSYLPQKITLPIIGIITLHCNICIHCVELI